MLFNDIPSLRPQVVREKIAPLFEDPAAYRKLAMLSAAASLGSRRLGLCLPSPGVLDSEPDYALAFAEIMCKTFYDPKDDDRMLLDILKPLPKSSDEEQRRHVATVLENIEVELASLWTELWESKCKDKCVVCLDAGAEWKFLLCLRAVQYSTS